MRWTGCKNSYLILKKSSQVRGQSDSLEYKVSKVNKQLTQAPADSIDKRVVLVPVWIWNSHKQLVLYQIHGHLGLRLEDIYCTKMTFLTHVCIQ